MSSRWISIGALMGMFVLATLLPINMGVIALVGAFLGVAALRSAVTQRLSQIAFLPNPSSLHE